MHYRLLVWLFVDLCCVARAFITNSKCNQVSCWCVGYVVRIPGLGSLWPHFLSAYHHSTRYILTFCTSNFITTPEYMEAISTVHFEHETSLRLYYLWFRGSRVSASSRSKFLRLFIWRSLRSCTAYSVCSNTLLFRGDIVLTQPTRHCLGRYGLRYVQDRSSIGSKTPLTFHQKKGKFAGGTARTNPDHLDRIRKVWKEEEGGS